MAHVVELVPPCVTKKELSLPVIVAVPEQDAEDGVPPPEMMWPFLSTLNWLVPPFCRSMREDAAAEAVSVMFSVIPANVTPPAFQVCVTAMTGADVVTVAPVPLNEVAVMVPVPVASKLAPEPTVIAAVVFVPVETDPNVVMAAVPRV